jgi:hypothetical protein
MFVRAMLLMVFIALAGCGSDELPKPPGTGSSSGGPPVTPPAAVAPAITGQPASISVNAGQTATFSVAATGTGPLAYQWRRNGVDIAGATAATYTVPAAVMGDTGASYTAVITNGAGSVTSAAAILTVSLPAGTTASLVVERTTALLKAVGESTRLSARPVDAQGATIAGTVTWSSSNPGQIAVDSSGRVTAQAIGSAMIFAEANGRKSQPIFVLAAEPVAGAVMLDDAQIVEVVGAPDLGDHYEVTVSGLATAPVPGTIVLASGDAAVAGKLVSSRSAAGNLVLTLELVPLPDVLARYRIDWDIDLGAFPVEDLEVDSATPVSSARRKLAAADDDPPGPFKAWDCGESEFNPTLVKPSISLTPQFSAARLKVESGRDTDEQSPEYTKVALTGSVALKGSAGVKLEPGFEGSFTCIASKQIKIPVGGPLSLLVMPALRLGAGFAFDGKLVIATGELKVTGTLGLRHTLGFECTGPSCRPLQDFELIDDFKLDKTVPSLNDMHVELSGQIFALAGIDAVFGGGIASAHILDARYGPKQTFDLAFPDDQAQNAGMASNYKLDMDGMIQPGAALAKAIKKLVGDGGGPVSLNFKVPFSTPIAASPKGTLDLSTGNVGYGSPVAFQVHLQQPLTYPFVGPDFEMAYNVDGIKLYRKKLDDPTFTEWVTIPTHAGQSTFQHEWTPTSADMGDWQFAAFVDTLIAVPVLEVAEDSVKHLHVRGPGWSGNVTFTMTGTEAVEQTDSGPSGTSTTQTVYTDSANGSYLLETLPDAVGLPILRVASATGTIQKSIVETWTSQHRTNGCNVSASQTREDVQSGNLRALAGTFAVISFQPDGTYEISIPNLVADTRGTLRVSAQETWSGDPACNSPQPTDTTTATQGNLQSALLTVTGTAPANATSINGTAEITFPGTPDRVYSVTWSLQQ